MRPDQSLQPLLMPQPIRIDTHILSFFLGKSKKGWENMIKIEQTLTSMEVAEMVGKQHKNLLADVRGYVKELGELKIQPTDFFRENTYKTAQNKTLPCYDISKKGCEFIAHKLTGVKGTAFTARYINRFHDMEEELRKQTPSVEERPWFIRRFMGDDVILLRDFNTIVGMDVMVTKKFFHPDYFKAGLDWNGYGSFWKEETEPREEFERKFGFEFGEEPVLIWLTLAGAEKAVQILEKEPKVKMLPEAKETILNGIQQVTNSYGIEEKQKPVALLPEIIAKKDQPIQINIYLK